MLELIVIIFNLFTSTIGVYLKVKNNREIFTKFCDETDLGGPQPIYFFCGSVPAPAARPAGPRVEIYKAY